MRITYPAHAEEFRAELRSFLSESLPSDWTGLGALDAEVRDRFRTEWRQRLHDNGYLALAWPREFGGQGRSYVEQVVLAEEFARAGVPTGGKNDSLSIGMLGNTLVHRGDDAQKRHHLPRILTGENVWCQGFSEPDAGSDLASLRTRARRSDRGWHLSGHKIWSTRAHLANHMFVLARTGEPESRHRGLTFFLLDMRQPGVVVSPIRNMVGFSEFNEVFLDDALVPHDGVVGAVDGGWRVAMTLLEFERGVTATTDAILYGREIDDLTELAGRRGKLESPHVRRRLAWCRRQVRIMELRGWQVVERQSRGEPLGPDSAIAKLMWSEFAQEYTRLAMEILGHEAALPVGLSTLDVFKMPELGSSLESRRWIETYLADRAGTIYSGSSQIQRNVVGERVLGLPR